MIDFKYIREIVDALRYNTKHNLNKERSFINELEECNVQNNNWIINILNDLDIKYTDVGILGCGLGSNLIPSLSGKITGYDLDPYSLEFASKLFPNCKFIQVDIWADNIDLSSHDLIIIRICNQLPPINSWPNLKNCKPNAVHVYQSDYEFESEIHPMLDILYSDKLNDRHMIIGKM